METLEICHPPAPESPSSSSSTQDEEFIDRLISLMAILMEDENSPIIPKVPHRLRQVNEKAYEPNVISIGPYHHDKEHLKEMEDTKKRVFKKKVGESEESLQAAITEELDTIKKCYVDTNGLSDAEFVKMMVLDGFFIVQLFRDIPRSLSRRRYFVNEIVYDLLLLENQLPFVVLEKIYKIMTLNEETAEESVNEETAKKFTDLALGFFEVLIGKTKSSECATPKHLLGLIHDTPRWRPSNGTKQEDEETKDQSKRAKCGWNFILCGIEEEETGKKAKRENTTDPEVKEERSNGNEKWWKKVKCGWKFMFCGRKQEEIGKNAKQGNFIRCARELEEAGISFEMRDEKKDKCRALDIVFKGNCRKAKLRIPKLTVGDNTERMLRNLIAFEQLLPFRYSTYVCDYVYFLDQLINTEKDVQLLRYSGIIENYLGDDQAVAQVFNRICDNTYASSNFYYAGVFKQVNHHCDNRWNKHLANLHRNYFNSPWTFMSFLAALILLLFTIAQTILALLTVGCHSCMVVLIVIGVIIVVIFLVYCLCLG